MADFKLGRLKFVWKGAWQNGTAYVKDDIVSYGGNAFVAEEAFTSNANFYTDLDAGKWTKIAGGTEWKNAWAGTTYYKVDDLVKWGGNVYRCNTGHVSQTSLSDDTAKWDTYAEGFDYKTSWTQGTEYKENDVVKVGGTTWVAINTHTASSTFDQDSANWSKLVEGTQWKSTYTQGTRYEIGDVVSYGGFLYITTTGHTAGATLDENNFGTYLEGLKNGGDWTATGVVYKKGQVVRWGGRSYLCIQSHDPAGLTVSPSQDASPSYQSAYWSLLVKGFDWRGSWSNTTTYRLDDVVEYATSSYICVQAHNVSQVSGDSVTPGFDVNYWQLMSQGDSNAVITTRGDMIFRDATQTTRLPIGPSGSFLISSGNEPRWGNLTPQKDYYVSEQGDDTNDGRTAVTAFRTIKKACEETFNLGQCRINVQAGLYTEQCPIRVGKSVVLEGNGLGAVTVSPNTTVDKGFGVGVSDDGSTPNANSFVFHMNNGSRMRNFVFRNFSTGAVIVSLDPGTGPNDTTVWITSQSPYVQNCTSFTPGGTGFKIDGALHNGGYKSMVANDWTQINSDGIGIHVLNDGRTEIVSCFTYYCNNGYLAESGGKIRAIVGNNSYGEFGAVARGFSQSETPKTGKFRLPTAVVKSIQTIGDGVVINRTFVDDDKNVYMVGYTSPSTASGNRPAYDNANSKPYIAKYDTGGNLLFQSTYDGIKGQLTSATVIDTQLYCGGQLRQSGTDKGFLLKVTANGDIQWQKTVSGTTIMNAVTTDGTRLFAVGDHDTYGATLIRVPAGGASIDFAKGIDFNDSSLNTLVPTAIAHAGDATQSGATYGNSGDADAQNKIFVTFNDTTNNNTFIGRFSSTTGTIETTYQYGNNLRLHDLDIDTGSGDGIYMIASGYYSDPAYSYALTNITYGGGSNATYVSADSTSTLLALNTAGNSPTQISDLTRDRKLRGVSSGAVATIVSYNGINSNNIEIAVTIDSGTFLNGEQIQLYQSGQPMPFIMRTTMDGTVQWQHSLRNIDGGEYLAGYGVGNVVYAVGYAVTNLGGSTPDIRRDAIISRYSSNGSLQWQKKIFNSNTGEFSEFNGVGVDGTNVVATGYTSDNNAVYFNSERDGSGPGTISGADFTFADTGMTENTNTMASRDISILDERNLSISVSDTNLTLNTSTGFTNNIQATRNGFTGIGRGITFSVDELSGSIKKGSILQIAGDTETYFVLDVSDFLTGDSTNAGTATISIDPPIVVTKIPEDQTNLTFREAFSQVRMTGHDFLDIGTGGFADTNYPVIIQADYTQQPSQNRETLSEDGGRVFYVSTDQDGNFRVGDYFKVEQSTGRATLSSEEFDLTGLNELQLGSVKAGKKGATIDEFSTDGTFADNSDTAVPTEKAVVTYVTDRLNAGAASANLMKDADVDTTVKVDLAGDGSDNVIRFTANNTESVNIADQYLLVPRGTTAQRPTSPVAGQMRFNSDSNGMEVYNGSAWVPVGGLSNIDVTGTYNAGAFQLLWCNTTSGPFTVNLPVTPSKGDTVRIVDVANTFDTNNLTIGRNGQLIMGDAADMTVDTEGASFDLIYYDATYGWKLFTV